MKVKDYFMAKNMFFAFADINELDNHLINRDPFQVMYYDQYISGSTLTRIIKLWSWKRGKRAKVVTLTTLNADHIPLEEHDIVIIHITPDEYNQISDVMDGLASACHLPKYAIFTPIVSMDDQIGITKSCCKLDHEFIKFINEKAVYPKCPKYRINRHSWGLLLSRTDDLASALKNTNIPPVIRETNEYMSDIRQIWGKIFKDNHNCNEVLLLPVSESDLCRIKRCYDSLIKIAMDYHIDDHLIMDVKYFYKFGISENY